MIGNIPPSIIFRGKHGHKYFTTYGTLRNITKLKPWRLYNVLIEKYEWKTKDAKEFTEFIEPMLDFDINLRATAIQCLQHPWLIDSTNTEETRKLDNEQKTECSAECIEDLCDKKDVPSKETDSDQSALLKESSVV